MVEAIHSAVYQRKKIRLFGSEDLEEQGQIQLTNDENVEMLRLLVIDHYYLILQNETT